MPMTGVERLLAIEEIKRLRSRYCRFLDAKRWDDLPALFTDGAEFWGFASCPDGSSFEGWRDGVKFRLSDVVMFHHCHSPDIVFIDDHTARAVWAMEGYLEWPEPIGLEEAPEARGMRGFGHYQDEYRLVDGTWKIAHIRFCTMRMGALSPDLPLQRLPTAPIQPGWLPGE